MTTNRSKPLPPTDEMPEIPEGFDEWLTSLSATEADTDIDCIKALRAYAMRVTVERDAYREQADVAAGHVSVLRAELSAAREIVIEECATACDELQEAASITTESYTPHRVSAYALAASTIRAISTSHTDGNLLDK